MTSTLIDCNIAGDLLFTNVSVLLPSGFSEKVASMCAQVQSCLRRLIGSGELI